MKKLLQENVPLKSGLFKREQELTSTIRTRDNLPRIQIQNQPKWMCQKNYTSNPSLYHTLLRIHTSE